MFHAPITTEVAVILSFLGKDQMFYDAPLILAIPVDRTEEALDAFEVETIRQVLEPIPAEKLGDLVKISLQYATDGRRNGKPIDLTKTAEAQSAFEHLHRHNGKYYFQPDQRDPHEQRIVDALGIASELHETA